MRAVDEAQFKMTDVMDDEERNVPLNAFDIISMSHALDLSRVLLSGNNTGQLTSFQCDLDKGEVWSVVEDALEGMGISCRSSGSGSHISCTMVSHSTVVHFDVSFFSLDSGTLVNVERRCAGNLVEFSQLYRELLDEVWARDVEVFGGGSRKGGASEDGEEGEDRDRDQQQIARRTWLSRLAFWKQ